ncbi:MAG: VCBS repeat-containing protein [Desulfotomaculaceae bacterium]|nr:VCBS repeat-containing protein [Desulfotomaculaceae bacterium]
MRKLVLLIILVMVLILTWWMLAANYSHGDITGDGKDDVLVGNPQVNWVKAYALEGESLKCILEKTSDSLEFGISVAGIGDVNNDNKPDFAVGEARGGPFTNDFGQVSIFSSNGQLIRVIEGQEPGGRFGLCISCIGKVNEDSIYDFAVVEVAGAPGSTGKVYIFSGADGSTLKTLTGAGYGFSFSGVGDLNSNGLSDILINAGDYIDIRDGNTGELIDNLAIKDVQSISGIGDVNGDGVADFIAGLNKANFGQVLVYSGADRHVLKVFTQSAPSYGCTVSGIGDANRDGVPDFAVGSAGAQSSSGKIFVYSGASFEVLFEHDSFQEDFGRSLAGAGDVNGDGYKDLIAAAQNNNGSSKKSSAFIFSGKDGTLMSEIVTPAHNVLLKVSGVINHIDLTLPKKEGLRKFSPFLK